MKKLLFRADDLGYSEAINYGIEKTVKEGLISNVGVMVNMPATQHGVDRIKKCTISFGQHTNISVGRSLTDPEKIPSLTTSDGGFKSSKSYRMAKKDFVNYEEALMEIEAQYHVFKRLFGRDPDYLDGHAVASKNFFQAIADFAKAKKITYSGLPEGMETNGIQQEPYVNINGRKVYVTMESMQPNYDPYQMIEEVLLKDHQDGIDMLVFHPGYLDNYIFEHSSLLRPRVLEVDALTSLRTKHLLKIHEVGLVEFKAL